MEKKESLHKTLGLADVFCISAGAMISSGIFILPGVAFQKTGPAVILAYLLAGICAMVGSLATIELATAMPLAGGIYFYTGRSMGALAGTVSGLLNWSAIALKSSFAIFGMSEVLFQLFNIDPLCSGILLTLFFLMVNLIGTKEAAIAQIVMVFFLLLAMAAYIAAGFPELKVSRFTPFFFHSRDIGSLFAEAAFVFVSFGGLLDVASISEEVRNPKRNLPFGMLAATLVVTAFYVLSLVVTVGVLPAEKLAGSLTPLADAAQMYYGRTGYCLITFGAMMAFVTTANAGVMAAARFPYAMGRDSLIPQYFSRTYGRRKMPLPALLLTGTAMVGAQLLPLEKLVSVASTVIMLSFILTNAAVIILREGEVKNYQPSFRMPFYPWLPLISMVLFGLLIMELGISAVKLSLLIILIGFVLYFFFGRKVHQEYALMYLMRRITKKRMALRSLESELRDIVRFRDEMVNDLFDTVIENSHTIVEEKPLDFPALAEKICALAVPQPALAKELAAKLAERERASSTVLTPFVAIPHLSIEGSNVFKLIAVKCADGVFFHEKAKSVHAVFFLFCTMDRRQDYLQTLAAIAQILLDPEFEEHWERAKLPEEVRDVLLLSKRRRIPRG